MPRPGDYNHGTAEVATEPFEDVVRRGGATALEQAGRFFMREDPVNQSLRRIAARLDELRVPYVVAGGMALVAHGYDRTTVDVDIILTAEGLAQLHRCLEGLGYIPPFKGSKNLRDAATGVRIEFLITGHFPGDGKPKPVAFPDPRAAGVEIDGVRYVSLPLLVELKLASGMSSAGRLKDLADVQELVRTLNLPIEFAEQLNPYVQAKFAELWNGVREEERRNPNR